MRKWRLSVGLCALALACAVSTCGAQREDGTVRFSTPPESYLADTRLDTGKLPSEGADLFSLKAATVLRSFSLQSEYMQAFVNAPRRGVRISPPGGMVLYRSRRRI